MHLFKIFYNIIIKKYLNTCKTTNNLERNEKNKTTHYNIHILGSYNNTISFMASILINQQYIPSIRTTNILNSTNNSDNSLHIIILLHITTNHRCQNRNTKRKRKTKKHQKLVPMRPAFRSTVHV
jgi:hypothetical protein